MEVSHYYHRTHPVPPGHPRDLAVGYPQQSQQSYAYGEERPYRDSAPHSHPQGPSTACPPASRYGQPPPPQRRLSSPTQTSQSLPGQQQAAEARSDNAAQMQRFLSLLNKGVDVNQLTTMIRESMGKSTSRSSASASTQPAREGERYDPFKVDQDHTQRLDSRDWTSKDDLLPHERAMEDGSGFSRILGLASQEPQKRVGEEEKMAHAIMVAEANANQYVRLSAQPETSLSSAQYKENPKSSVAPEGPTPAPAAGKEKEKEQYFDKVQNLLKAIGLNLNSSEVTQLTDRMKERLYGGKTREASSESKSSERSSGRQRSRTDSADSDPVRSASPAKRACREDYRSQSRHSRHSSEYESEGTSRRSTEPGVTPERSSYTPETSSQKYDPYAYSQDSRHTPDPAHPAAVSSVSLTATSTSYPHSATNPSYHYPYSAHAQPAFSAQYASYSAASARDYDPFTYSAGYAYAAPPSTTQDATAASFSSSYSASTEYLLNPEGSDPYAPLQPSGSSSFSLEKPEKAEQDDSNAGRCLTVIEPVSSEAMSDLIKARPPMLTEEDVKARQKQKLDQYTQKMKEKHEKLMELMRISKRTASAAATAGKKEAPAAVASMEMRNVWVCGHSLVDWAEKRAKSSEVRVELGMDPENVRFWWKGVQGMTWDQLLPQVHQLKLNWPNPDVLIVHLGGNDINKGTAEDLLSAIKRDLTSIHSIFPKCKIVWSDILPRRFWKDGSGIIEDRDSSVNSLVGAINRKVHSIVAELGGVAVSHDNIGTGLYRPDGIHLSKGGIDTFNMNLQDYLEKWESGGG